MSDISIHHYSKSQKEINNFVSELEAYLKVIRLFDRTDKILEDIRQGNQLLGKAYLLKESLKNNSDKLKKWDDYIITLKKIIEELEKKLKHPY